MNVPEFLQLSDAFVVGSNATDMRQLHDFPAGNVDGVSTIIPLPQVK